MQPNPLVIDFIVSGISNKIDVILSHRAKLSAEVVGALVRLDRALTELETEIEVSQSLLGAQSLDGHRALSHEYERRLVRA